MSLLPSHHPLRLLGMIRLTLFKVPRGRRILPSPQPLLTFLGHGEGDIQLLLIGSLGLIPPGRPALDQLAIQIEPVRARDGHHGRPDALLVLVESPAVDGLMQDHLFDGLLGLGPVCLRQLGAGDAVEMDLDRRGAVLDLDGVAVDDIEDFPAEVHADEHAGDDDVEDDRRDGAADELVFARTHDNPKVEG